MISIIIPTLNEASTIMQTIDRVKSLSGAYEILVIDGGSSDKTLEIASEHVLVFTSNKGRGNQMNCGAQHARGDILWFLHSDSRVEAQSLISIEKSIASGYVGGCFSLYFYDYTTLFLKWLSWSSNLRAKYLKLMFGDQGMFVRKDAFLALGGFKDMPIMEDWDLSKGFRLLEIQ